MSEDRQATRIAGLEKQLQQTQAEAAGMREALEGVASSVCSRLCPTTWPTAEGRRHHESCETVKKALSGETGKALLAERDQLHTIVNELNDGCVELEKERDRLKGERERDAAREEVEELKRKLAIDEQQLADRLADIGELMRQLADTAKERDRLRGERKQLHNEAEHMGNLKYLAEQRAEHLEKFKAYVHERLDKAGVPNDPDPERNAKHGCRIEGRLNWVFAQLEPKEAHEEAIRADEREACARLVEYDGESPVGQDVVDALNGHAQAIRARGKG